MVLARFWNWIDTKRLLWVVSAMIIVWICGCSSVVNHHDLKRGVYYYHQGDFVRARTELSQLVTRSPADTTAVLYLGWSEFFLGNHAVSQEIFQSVLNRSSVESVFVADAWHGVARSAFKTYQYPVVIEAARKSLELVPEQMELWLLKGWAELYAYKYAEAERSFKLALELETANGEAWLGIGWTHYYRSEYHKAILAVDHARRWKQPESLLIILETACYDSAGNN